MTIRTPSPDPIEEPRAYQQHLLGLLGRDDPAEVQAATPPALRQLLSDAGPDLRLAPEPGEWSVFQCIAHLVDAEIMMSSRFRWIVAQDQPTLMGYDQDLWMNHLHSEDESVEDVLSLFRVLRTANLALWNRSTEEQRARFGLHSERGPESYDLCFRMMAGHDRFHMAQARRALAVVRSG